jgi:heme/copper-type cytochrome/quinol oxidase subunit 3
MSWFIFRGDVLRRLLRRAVLCAHDLHAVAGRPGPQVHLAGFRAALGNVGPAGTVEEFKTMGPFPIPTINTALLLTSGVTLTIAHHALRAGHRAQTAIWLFATILLGAVFMGFQAYEYTTPTPS